MADFNEAEFMLQIQELLDIIEEHEFHDMEVAYIEQLEKLGVDLSGNSRNHITDYIESLATHISELKSSIINRFSVHNNHLTEDYLDQLITTDRILFAELKYTTKNDDCFQYLKAKEQYSLEFKDMLFSIPEVYALSINLQNKLWTMSMQVAELNFLLNQHWTIKA
mgnify:CR=1 FL=1